MAPQTITTDTLLGWANQHEGSDDAKWTAQDVSNVTQERDIHSLRNRITAVEKRLLVVCAFAAGAGGALGQIITSFFA